MHVPVVIIGSGPAGLLLSHLLHVQGIESVILERKSRDYVEGRIRAGVLEMGTVDLMKRVGVDARMNKEGIIHGGIYISVNGKRTHVNMEELTGGSTVMIYGQTEVTKDLIAARLAHGGEIVFEAEDVSLHDIDSDKPRVRYVKDGTETELSCDYIAACDGFHGVGRKTLPGVQEFEKVYPFGWLGVLAHAKPVADELIYAKHERGFALCSMRSETVVRHYVQVPITDKIEDWSDDRFWAELRTRLGEEDAELVNEGDVFEKSIAPLRSFVAEPMQHGRLFLAGDAAHIVPPTGAKGLNLAASDVHYLSEALIAKYKNNREDLLAGYSDTALARVWKAERFSWWMTSMLHTFGDQKEFDGRIRDAELQYILSSKAGLTNLSENYVGLPY
ncbi:4-hydroxybenzoate 3-monooxygenase [Thalassospira profundimaris]|uniref:4-hydroxybenzoate 3-monooxygenase n=1 Tax=Thalassospira profundimaris TaxID=502049 RepID=A0A367W4G3_9PROT|nr:4-hydroxybenzoate 3-monooxygenase [Thalassospira profundimaris]RCK33852.1 4-hydroxybenzoate 3-monooxygenase [Thalassospira profundimaris]